MKCTRFVTRTEWTEHHQRAKHVSRRWEEDENTFNSGHGHEYHCQIWTCFLCLAAEKKKNKKLYTFSTRTGDREANERTSTWRGQHLKYIWSLVVLVPVQLLLTGWWIWFVHISRWMIVLSLRAVRIELTMMPSSSSSSSPPPFSSSPRVMRKILYQSASSQVTSRFKVYSFVFCFISFFFYANWAGCLVFFSF